MLELMGVECHYMAGQSYITLLNVKAIGNPHPWEVSYVT